VGYQIPKISVYHDPEQFTFETIDCPVLGYVSAKTCECCRTRRLGRCPLHKSLIN
jgi:hypothetical protein